jgi:excisionase family DNA binding protein
VFSAEFTEALAAAVAAKLPSTISGSRIAPRYLSYDQAGEYIGVSAEAVRAYVRGGYFPVTIKGGKRWIDKEDIDRFMKNNKSYAA